jgi:hypothetical protein
MKRAMSVEDALRWAVRDELPKARPDLGSLGAPRTGFSSPAYAAQAAGTLGAMAVAVNRYGVVSELTQFASAAPHADALKLGEAMLALDDCRPAAFGDWEPFEDAAPACADEAAAWARASALARGQAGTRAGVEGGLGLRAVSGLMVKAAVLGPPGGWELGEVKMDVMRTENGQPRWFRSIERACRWNDAGEACAWEMVEVDGYNDKGKRPHADAYRRTVLTPDPLGVALARADWQVWRVALDVVFEDVMERGGLGTIELQPCALPWRPWMGDEARPAQGRVMPSLQMIEAHAVSPPPQAGRSLAAMSREEHAARYRRERAAIEQARRGA